MKFCAVPLAMNPEAVVFSHFRLSLVFVKTVLPDVVEFEPEIKVNPVMVMLTCVIL
jgi:hypothetical protein